ncbi:MAG TPA: hypothetical protein VM620_03905 [Hyphomicrobium sp.]|nr:hypothetical protein [Hyphomicrobium sp.]
MFDDYVPLTREQARHKIHLMNCYIKFLGPDWTQQQLEKREGFFTTLSRQGAQPDWQKFSEAFQRPQKGTQQRPTAVLNSPESTTTEAVVLNFPEPFKACTSCREEKPLADFYNHPKGNNGKHPECKACMRAKALAHKRAA